VNEESEDDDFVDATGEERVIEIPTAVLASENVLAPLDPVSFNV
jgi:hypothetical protein